MALSDEQLNQIVQKYQLSPASNPSQNSNSLRGADLLKSLEDNNDQNTNSNTISEQPKKTFINDYTNWETQKNDKNSQPVSEKPITLEERNKYINQLGNIKNKATNHILNEAKGLAKGVGNTAKGLLNISEKYFNPFSGIKGYKEPDVLLGDRLQSMVENKLGLEQGDLLKPKGTSQNMGFTGEQIGEFLIPAGELTKAGEAIKGAKIFEGGGLVKKGLGFLASKVPESAVGAFQGAIQDGGNANPENLAKGAATNFAINSALPLAGRLVGKTAAGLKNTISPDVESALTKAIKPKGNNAKFAESLKTALPDIQETAQTLGKKIENIDHLDDVITQAKKRVWKNYEDILGPNANSQIDGNKIADNIVKGIDKRFITQNPEKYKKIVAVADTYRRPMSLTEAEDFLQSTNNELHSYYAKNKVQQAVAMGDPEVSHIVRENDALRNELNTKLSELTGVNAKEIKNRYGALSNIQSEIVPRKNVIARQNPVGLAEQIGYGRAAGNILKSAANFQLGDAAAGAADLATTRFLKLKNDPNELIRSAFQKLEKNPSSKYAKVMSKFVPAGYLPEKASHPNQINLPSKGILEGQAKLRK